MGVEKRLLKLAKKHIGLTDLAHRDFHAAVRRARHAYQRDLDYEALADAIASAHAVYKAKRG